ncbi:MAG: hypothetical protein LBS05_02525 [Tannerellaceae bacterium]|jgi:hypothetical protein|nr:hypothetical protein [Tannerellaceae bacterium]
MKVMILITTLFVAIAINSAVQNGCRPQEAYVFLRQSADEPEDMFYFRKAGDTDICYYLWYQDRQVGPFDDIRFASCYPDNQCDYLFKREGRWYAHLKTGGSITAPLADGDGSDPSSFCITESGNYAYRLRRGGKSYINLNGELIDYGADSFIHSLALTDDSRFSFLLYDPGKRKTYQIVNSLK